MELLRNFSHSMINIFFLLTEESVHAEVVELGLGPTEDLAATAEEVGDILFICWLFQSNLHVPAVQTGGRGGAAARSGLRLLHCAAGQHSLDRANSRSTGDYLTLS